MSALRLFVALDLPPEARAALAAFRDAAADPAVWRPVGDDALHLTLAFLGRRPPEAVAAAGRVLEACAGPAPALALGGALLLPPRRPRVLCVAVGDSGGALAALQSRVSAGSPPPASTSRRRARSVPTPRSRGCGRASRRRARRPPRRRSRWRSTARR